LLFIDLCSIAALGVILAYVIPPGQHGKYFLFLHRHDWGDIHLYLSVFLLVLLIFHLWFNWAWITASTKAFVGDKWKEFLSGLACAWLAVLLVGWLIKLM
jgi:hypothetical protein